MQLDEQDERSRKDNIDDRSVTSGKVTETTSTTILEKKAMNTEENRADDGGQLGFASWVWIGLAMSLFVNILLAMNSVCVICLKSTHGPRVVNQNICNFYYVESRDLKTLADIRAMDETDLSGDIETKPVISKQ